MKQNRVHVLAIESQYGINMVAFTTIQKADDYLYEYVKHYWKRETQLKGVEMPNNKKACIKKYFEEMLFFESWCIDTVKIDEKW